MAPPALLAAPAALAPSAGAGPSGQAAARADALQVVRKYLRGPRLRNHKFPQALVAAQVPEDLGPGPELIEGCIPIHIVDCPWFMLWHWYMMMLLPGHRHSKETAEFLKLDAVSSLLLSLRRLFLSFRRS